VRRDDKMAFAAARMILKDKRRKASKEDFAPRNRSKVKKLHTIMFCCEPNGSSLARTRAEID